MIKSVKPHEIIAIKRPSDFLIFTKNMFRCFEKNGFLLKKEGFYTSVRWSILHNSFVLDNGTNKNRDISGINMSNLDQYYDTNSNVYKIYKKILTNLIYNKSSHEVFEKYKLKKNYTKCIILYVTENSYYVRGVFQNCKSKKRDGCFCDKNIKYKIITNIKETNDELTHAIKADVEDVITINRYTKTYLDFIQFINNKKYSVLSESSLVDLENILYKNNPFVKTDKNRDYSDYKKFIAKGCNSKMKHFELFFLEKALLEFIQSLGYENIVYFDKAINDFISFPSYKQKFVDKDSNKEYNANYSLNLFPKII
jgi:hypothetical protein